MRFIPSAVVCVILFPTMTFADEGSPTAKVDPGKVTWHENFQAACRAGQRSKKPVMLFQMVGRLDQAML